MLQMFFFFNHTIVRVLSQKVIISLVIISAKEIIFLVMFVCLAFSLSVCLCVCLSVSNITQNVMNGLR